MKGQCYSFDSPSPCQHSRDGNKDACRSLKKIKLPFGDAQNFENEYLEVGQSGYKNGTSSQKLISDTPF